MILTVGNTKGGVGKTTLIPVHRGDYDRALLEKILAIIKSGRPLVIAPKGGRSHEPAMRRAMPGVGYII